MGVIGAVGGVGTTRGRFCGVHGDEYRGLLQGHDGGLVLSLFSFKRVSWTLMPDPHAAFRLCYTAYDLLGSFTGSAGGGLSFCWATMLHGQRRRVFVGIDMLVGNTR